MTDKEVIVRLKIGDLVTSYFEPDGDIIMHPEFFDMHPIDQLDTLQDWVSALENLQCEVYDSLYGGADDS